MSPLARDLLIRARVINIKHDALTAARQGRVDPGLYGPPVLEKFSRSPVLEASPERERPKPVMILPSEHRRLRRMLMGLIVHRPAQH